MQKQRLITRLAFPQFSVPSLATAAAVGVLILGGIFVVQESLSASRQDQPSSKEQPQQLPSQEARTTYSSSAGFSLEHGTNYAVKTEARGAFFYNQSQDNSSLEGISVVTLDKEGVSELFSAVWRAKNDEVVSGTVDGVAVQVKKLQHFTVKNLDAVEFVYEQPSTDQVSLLRTTDGRFFELKNIAQGKAKQLAQAQELARFIASFTAL